MRYRTDSITGCWNWLGSCGRNGHAQVSIAGRSVPAYRVAYALLVGRIPRTYEVHHVCGNPRCINPYHLEAQPVRAHHIGHRRSHCKRGHLFTPENTYLWTRKDGRVSRQCRTCRAASR